MGSILAFAGWVLAQAKPREVAGCPLPVVKLCEGHPPETWLLLGLPIKIYNMFFCFQFLSQFPSNMQPNQVSTAENWVLGTKYFKPSYSSPKPDGANVPPMLLPPEQLLQKSLQKRQK